MLNRNIRCIHVEPQHKMYWNLSRLGNQIAEYELNRNIRCIEIVLMKFIDYDSILLNRNIRCIEIISNPNIQIIKNCWTAT